MRINNSIKCNQSLLVRCDAIMLGEPEAKQILQVRTDLGCHKRTCRDKEILTEHRLTPLQIPVGMLQLVLVKIREQTPVIIEYRTHGNWVFGTDGNYAKCWIREGENIFLYKTGSSRFEIEPLSEFLAAQLAAILCPVYVDYDLDFYRGKLISKCRLFTSEDHGLAKAAGIFQGERTIPVLLNYFEKLGSGDDFRRMCILDFLIFNPDRHYGNFGILFDTKTMDR